ncbi:phosphate ABC transporter permease subunit PstC [Cellulosilyticum sp. ST5]|uniref:Phosphate transport system permease protein n=1 Tax=Cellulosilyticum lentocellum (strain ATCC 49066 / DSM 5427 / NCIMB 11756 / RHM5) TaxID=642492 RepID=F2JSN3_CELLD|nr:MULTISPECIES: phosphate ABC transporter permease subunit PstC [Cellulosilyticum]ADZ82867.1 phosphate ABC transporter, inner membrane subunit PstC [Cellulosilyticum lentocellum DSM 5427]QEH68408.1 phosphate ABC transporter permease subunit PstC [Cellulosilyticum sp. WCF-2]
MKYMDKLMKRVFWLCAAIMILVVGFMAVYIIVGGVPFFKEVSIWDFLFGKKWNPSGKIFGIYPMLVASLYATLGATLIGVVVGVSTAIVLVEVLPQKVAKVFSAAIDLLAGIPSVIYGFFGLMVIVPILNDLFGGIGGGSSLLAAMLILAVMLLPTVIRMTEVSLRAVPNEYKEGALGLGASKFQYIFKVQLGAAKSGIMAGIVLGIGRALGETMAVILVAGNSVLIPSSIMDPVRTLTANIAMEMGYATGIHQQALFATGMVLFVLIMAINLVLTQFIRRAERRAR